MSAIDLRTEIIQLLQAEHDTSILEKIRMLLRGEEADAQEDFSAEELAELDAQREEHLRGEGKSYTAEESIRMIREDYKG